MFELVHINWSDCGDVAEVLDTCQAATEEEAARIFRSRGHLTNDVRAVGSRWTRPLDLLLRVADAGRKSDRYEMAVATIRRAGFVATRLLAADVSYHLTCLASDEYGFEVADDDGGTLQQAVTDCYDAFPLPPNA